MKRIVLLSFLCILSASYAQGDLNNLLAAGLEDANAYTSDYLGPVTESAIYSVSNGWYNSADAKPLGGFEISIIGNITGFKNKDDKKRFLLDTADYQNLQFLDGSPSKEVATALGGEEETEVVLAYTTQVNGETVTISEQFQLPGGISEDISFIPSGYIQGSVGLIKGLEVKARFLPKLDFEDVELGLFGAGLQYDFTKILPADKVLPIAISAVIGYTSINGEYDFTETNVVDGENQKIDASISTWNFSAVVSTKKIPVINFYGGIGYISGKSEVDLLGTYEISTSGATLVYTDPISVENSVSGVTANVGTKIKLGFFRLNVDYNISEFSTLTAGINFGFR